MVVSVIIGVITAISRVLSEYQHSLRWYQSSLGLQQASLGGIPMVVSGDIIAPSSVVSTGTLSRVVSALALSIRGGEWGSWWYIPNENQYNRFYLPKKNHAKKDIMSIVYTAGKIMAS